MHVLHVTPYFAPAFGYGGPPRSILGLCKALLRTGVKIDVFTTTANGYSDLPASSGGADIYEGVSVRYFPRTFPKPFFGVTGLTDCLASGLDRYDLLHVHGLWNLPAWIASRRARRIELPYVISPRGMLEPRAMDHNSLRKRFAYRVTERRNLESAAFLHATSVAEGETFKSYGFDSEIVILPNGLDIEDWDSLPRGTFRREHGIDEEAKLVLFLGRIHPIKRLDLLADAFCQVEKVIPNAHLVIAGPDEGGYRKVLEPAFSCMRKAAHWVGEVREAARQALLKDVDLLVMCSDSESFGMSVVEAMAAGLPVVVTRTCPWQEIETAGCGLWVPQESREIAEAVIYLLNHRSEARAMGERGEVLVRNNYCWDSIARKMANHYAEALCQVCK